MLGFLDSSMHLSSSKQDTTYTKMTPTGLDWSRRK